MSDGWIISELARRVEARPIPTAHRPAVIPDVDDPDHDGDILGYAEGQTFMIEYVDSKGQPSARRITVFDIISGAAGVPFLRARCHERKATRQFRIDRITCCIDYSGEIYDDVPAFLSENFGIAASLASARADDQISEEWDSVISTIRADATLLSAMAKADGEFSESELLIIVDHLAGRVEKRVKFLSPREIKALSAYVRRLRPSVEAISRAVNSITDEGPRRIEQVLRAKVDVMDADGHRHEEEIIFLNRIANEFIGVSII